jgi:hypothetical protein
MGEFIGIALACFGFLWMGYDIGQSKERRQWCDKYEVRSEYDECMKNGAKNE